MNAFAILQPDIRRALARKELRRRGAMGISEREIRKLLEAATDKDLERLEALTAPFDHLPEEAWPEDIRSLSQAIFAGILRNVREVTHDLDEPVETPEQLEHRCEELLARLEPLAAERAEKSARWRAATATSG
jgi:hypothetical protein